MISYSYYRGADCNPGSWRQSKKGMAKATDRFTRRRRGRLENKSIYTKSTNTHDSSAEAEWGGGEEIVTGSLCCTVAFFAQCATGAIWTHPFVVPSPERFQQRTLALPQRRLVRASLLPGQQETNWLHSTLHARVQKGRKLVGSYLWLELLKTKWFAVCLPNVHPSNHLVKLGQIPDRWRGNQLRQAK